MQPPCYLSFSPKAPRVFWRVAAVVSFHPKASVAVVVRRCISPSLKVNDKLEDSPRSWRNLTSPPRHRCVDTTVIFCTEWVELFVKAHDLLWTTGAWSIWMDKVSNDTALEGGPSYRNVKNQMKYLKSQQVAGICHPSNHSRHCTNSHHDSELKGRLNFHQTKP